MAREPSDKQLDYLKVLGYRGIQPETMTEASILIDEMKSSGDSKAAAEILKSYRLSTPTESSGRGAKGCLVMLLLIGGCVYWGSDPKDPPPPQKPIPVPQIVTPPSIELAPAVPPPDQPAAAESPPPQAPAMVEASVSEEPPPATTEDDKASKVSDAEAAEADRLAATQLQLAKQYIRIEQPADARKVLDAMIEKYPDAKATAEAKVLRESLSKKPR